MIWPVAKRAVVPVTLEEMGREAMAQRVQCQALLDPGAFMSSIIR
jgi:hypothetical protein